MTTDAGLGTDKNQKPEVDFEKAHAEAVANEAVSPISKSVSEALFARLSKIRPRTATLHITKDIEIASAACNVDEVLRLAKRLEQTKHDEKAQTDQLLEISKEFSFEELIAAYPKEVISLAHELALLAINASEEALAKSKKRDRSTTRKKGNQQVYVISKDGKSIECTMNKGRPANPGVDRPFYEFLGFKVSDDGKSLSPDSYKDANGQTTTSISRKWIILELLKGNSEWISMGYTISEKTTTPEAEPA
ncbi:hypothetical protein [Pseudomonas sp. PLMAX]|uniref:hypothetical protein n=1 Tax=Pseudomonas sp. PLMAX TaxID=2201998 RepID=UPI0038BA7B17